jgi:hypothetical protein
MSAANTLFAIFPNMREPARLGYNRPMRAFLTFLLCFAVALHGNANAHVFKQPCPMEQGAPIAMDMSGAAGDCCNDADTAAKTGKLCKTGQSCSVPVVGAIASLPLPALIVAASCPVPTARLVTLSFDLVAVWRPPTLS